MYNSIMDGFGSFAGILSFFILTIVAISLIGLIIFSWLLFITLFHTVIKKRNCRKGLRAKRILKHTFLALGWIFFGLFLFFLVLTYGGALFSAGEIINISFPIATLVLVYLFNTILPLFVFCRCSECKCHCGCHNSNAPIKQSKPKTEKVKTNTATIITPTTIQESNQKPTKQELKDAKRAEKEAKKAERQAQELAEEHSKDAEKQAKKDAKKTEQQLLKSENNQETQITTEQTESATPAKIEPINDGSIKQRFEKAEVKQQEPQQVIIPPVAPMFSDNTIHRRTQSIVHTQTPSITPIQSTQPQSQRSYPTTKPAEPVKSIRASESPSPSILGSQTHTTQLSPTHSVQVQTSQTVDRSTNIQSMQTINKREATLHTDGTITGNASQQTTKSTTQLHAERQSLKAQYDKLNAQLTQIQDRPKPPQPQGPRPLGYPSANLTSSSTSLKTAQVKYNETEVKDALSGLRSAMGDLQRQIDNKTDN